MRSHLLAICLFALLSGGSILSAQTYEWAKAFGGSDSYGSSISVDASGNVYTFGRLFGTGDFDPGAGVANLTSAGYADIFVQKLDASGNFLWAKSFGGAVDDYGLSLSVDASGNVYTTGSFFGTVDFDPGAGVANLTSAGYADVFVQKLDASGNFLWAKAFRGTLIEEGRSISVDALGHVYTTGFFEGTVDFNPGAGVANLTSAGGTDIFVQKMDAFGNFLWAKTFGGTNLDYGWSLSIDASGHVYTTGSFFGTVDFDPGAGVANLTSAGQRDNFVQKLDASGNFLWAKSFGGTDDEYVSCISVDASGHVYTTGSFFGTVDFDPGVGVANLTSAGQRDNFVQKLDASGNFLWAKSFGGTDDEYVSSRVDASGNVYTTGGFRGAVDFDPGVGVADLTSAGLRDNFVQKLDASGSFLWAKSFGGTDDDGGTSISVDASGHIYISGYFTGTVDFDPGPGTANLNSDVDGRVFILKLSDSPGSQTLTGTTVNAKFESQTQSLTYPPLTDVLVRLLDDQGFLLDSTFSGSGGAFTFNSISPEAHHASARYVSPGGDTFEVVHPLAGSNGQIEFVFPAAITSSVAALIPGLEHFALSISEINKSFTIDGYDLQTLQAMLIEAQHIEGNDMAVAQTLGRMLILQIALGSYYTNANLLLQERQLAIRDFSLFCASQLNVFEGLALLPGLSPAQKLIVEHVSGLLGKSIRTLSQVTLSVLPGEEGQETRASIEEAMDYVSLLLEGGYIEAVFKAAAEEYIVVNPMKRKIQENYLEVTQEPLDAALLQGLSFPVDEGFEGAYQQMNTRTTEAQNRMINGVQASTFTRGVGNLDVAGYGLFGIAEDLSAVADLGTILNALSKGAKVLKVTQAISLLSALAATDIYFKSNRADAVREIEQILLREGSQYGIGKLVTDEDTEDLDSCMNDYISQLRQVETHIQNGQYTQAETAILALLAIDSCASFILSNALAPIMAANEVLADSIPGYRDVFISDLAAPVLEADFYRIKVLNLCLAFSFDSLKSPYADSIRWATDTLESLWAIAQPKVDSAYTAAVQFPSPAYILTLSEVLPDSLAPGATALAKVVFYNAGNMTAHQVEARIFTEEGLLADPAVILLDSLAPGAKDSILFEFEAPLADVLAGYQVLFSSDNTSAGGIGGAILIGNPDFSTGITRSRVESVPLRVTPNPTAGLIYIAYEANLPGQHLLKIFTPSGTEVASQSYQSARPGMQRVAFDASALPAGLYLLLLETPEPRYAKVVMLSE